LPRIARHAVPSKRAANTPRLLLNVLPGCTWFHAAYTLSLASTSSRTLITFVTVLSGTLICTLPPAPTQLAAPSQPAAGAVRTCTCWSLGPVKVTLYAAYRLPVLSTVNAGNPPPGCEVAS